MYVFECKYTYVNMYAYDNIPNLLDRNQQLAMFMYETQLLIGDIYWDLSPS
jgi:hypothetical protein